MICTISKAVKGQMKAAPPSKAKLGDPVPSGFNFFIDETGKGFEVFGLNAGGHQVALDSVATLTVVSDTMTTATVTPPVGMSFNVAAATPAPAVGATTILTATVTWNDGSVGPFTATVTLTAVADPVTGLTFTPSLPKAA